MNLKDLLVGAALGALISLGIEFAHHGKPKPVAPPPRAAVSAPVPQIAAPAPNDAHAAWLDRRDLEFDRCATLHGTPTLGFGMRIVCLDSHAVKFLGEEHPPD